MDEVSIISMPDSDISFDTLIDGDQTTSTQPTPNQQFHICSLYVNHWVDGTKRKNEDLRSAKKDYIEGLKEKTSHRPASSSHRHRSSTYWPESSERTSHQSLNPREYRRKKGRSSKDSHQSHWEKKSRLSENKSKQFSATDVHKSEMDHHTTNAPSTSTSNLDDKTKLPDIPDLDDYIIPGTSPKMTINRIKFNTLNRAVYKKAIASDNNNYIVRNKQNAKMIIIKDETVNHRKSSDKKHRPTAEVATARLATDEVYSNKFAATEVSYYEVFIAEGDEVTNSESTNKIANNVVSNEVGDEPIVDKAMQNNPSHYIEIQVYDKNEITKDNNNQIESSHETEVSTSNFGGQKNDDEKDELLKDQERSISICKQAMQKYESKIKERCHEIVSHQNTILEQNNMIDERDKKIRERDRMIEERDLMIREREQKNKVYEDKIKLQEHKMFITMTELTRLNRSNTCLAAILNDKEMYCQEYHKQKPNPRKPRTIPQTIVRPPILTETNNLNVLQNGIPYISPQQTPVLFPRNINPFTGNLQLMLQTSPSTTYQTYCSTPTSTHLLTNSANITNTVDNTASSTMTNAATTLNGINGKTTRPGEPQTIRIQEPVLECTVDSLSNSSTETYPQDYPIRPTISTETSELSDRFNTYVPGNQSNFANSITQASQHGNLQHIQNVQQEQQRTLRQSLDQGRVLKFSRNQQPIFYCLECRKPGSLLCATCRNCCACSESCYELISPKHENECILPNIVSIPSL